MTDSGLLKSSAIYVVGSVLSRSIPFLILPVLTRHLSPEEYGLVATFTVLIGVTAPFVGINATGAIIRNYYELDRNRLSQYIGNCVFLLLLSFLAVFLIFLLLRHPLSSIAKFFSPLILIVPVVAAGDFLAQAALSIWRVRDKPLVYSLFNILYLGANFTISIVCVVLLTMGWQGRVVGILVSNVLFGFIAIGLLYRSGYLRFSIDRSFLKDAARFGLPLIPHMLGVWSILMVNRIFLNNMVGVDATGLFSVGAAFASIVFLLQSAFHQAWIPWLYTRLKLNDEKVNCNLVKITYMYFVVITLVALAVSFSAPWTTSFLFGDRFEGASEFVLWLSLGYAANGMYKMMIGYILFEKKTHLVAGITVFTGALSLYLNYILIKNNGAIGAAQALAITFFTAFVLTWIAAQKVYPMPWGIRLKGEA